MKLLKWFKRDAEHSPLRPAKPAKRRLSEPPATFENKLFRNDSYLKALAKFNNWRQMHLSDYAKKPKKVKSSKSSRSHEELNSSNLVYEEINLKSKEIENNILVKHKKIRKNPSNLSEYINYENSLSQILNIEHASSSCPIEEPEYAIPFNDSNDLGATQFQNYVQENFEFLDYEEFFDEYQHDSKSPLMVTDLDKSEEVIRTLEECEYQDNCEHKAGDKSLAFSALLEKAEFSEFLVCSLDQIKESEKKLSLKLIDGAFVRHGEVDSIKISYFEGACWHSIFNNYEKLSKLRHPYIMLLMGASIDTSGILNALIVEPLAKSLHSCIHSEEQHLSVEDCHKFALQITDAVIYLHRQEVVHSNICSLNIFENDDGLFKLGGFELATKVDINAMNICKPEHEVSTTSVLHQQLITSSEYRKKFAKFNYQAPELLAESQEFVHPTFQADVYGICITLWEILNCVVPYVQFTQNELLKVFSLKNAQLPIYEEERHLPYKSILDNGLELQLRNRIPTAIHLKRALQQIQIDNLNSNGGNHTQDNISYVGQGARPERISTLKKSNFGTNCLTANFLDKQKIEKPCSPIVYCGTKGNINMDTRSCIFYKEGLHATVTPSKKYSVNILVKSKYPRSAQQMAQSVLTESENENNHDSCMFPQSPNILDGRWDTPIFQRGVRKSISGDLFGKSPRREGTFITSTEDCYIDDGFSDSFGIGANIELNVNYLQKF